MEALKSFLAESWLGTLIAAVGVVAAYYFYRKSRVEPKLVYQAGGQHLIGEREATLPDEVEIFFKGVEVPRVTSTTVRVWNAGRGTIRGSDVVDTDPLRFTFSPSARILRVRVAPVTREVIAFRAVQKDNEAHVVLLAFDFLDKGDGAAIEVLHTGEERYPLIKGTVRGMPQGAKDWGRVLPHGITRSRVNFRRGLFLWTAAALGMVALTSGLLKPMLVEWFPKLSGQLYTSRNATINWKLVAFGLVYMLPGAALLWRTRRRFPKKLELDERS